MHEHDVVHRDFKDTNIFFFFLYKLRKMAIKFIKLAILVSQNNVIVKIKDC